MEKVLNGKIFTMTATEVSETELDWKKNEAKHAAERAKAETEETERAEIAAALNASDTSKIAILEAQIAALSRLALMQSPNLAEAAPLAAVEVIEKKRKGRKP